MNYRSWQLRQFMRYAVIVFDSDPTWAKKGLRVNRMKMADLIAAYELLGFDYAKARSLFYV